MSEPIHPSGGPALEPVPETPPAASWRPWGVFASLGLTVGVLVLYMVAQTVVVLLLVLIATIRSFEHHPDLMQNFGNGTYLAISVLVANPIFAGLVVLLARMRGPVVRTYLGLRWVGWKPLLGWTLAVVGFLTLFDLLGSWLGRPPVPEVMLDFYRTAEPKALIWIALVVLAPLFEELLFRGFLIPGLAARWGATAAVIVSSLIFAAIHLQYDLFDMSAVLLLGVLFGVARVATGSTMLPIVLHAGVNLVAALQMHVWA